jgi:hypothetical protein
MVTIALLLAAYHGGYLLVDYQSYKTWWSNRFWAAVALTTFPLLILVGSDKCWPIALVGILACSGAIHTARTQYMSDGAYTNEGKALFRFIGYIGGGVAAFWEGLPLLMMGAVPLLILYGDTVEQSWSDRYRTRGIYRLLAFIFFHHVQYFIVVYFLLVFLCRTFELPAFLAGGLMLIGWIGYSLAQSLILQYHRGLIEIFHLLNGLALICMSWALQIHSLDWVILLWCITGILGGSAYVVGLIPGLNRYGTKGSRNSAESFGHVCGVLLCALTAYLDLTLGAVMILGAAFSALAAILAAMYALGYDTPEFES